MHMKRLAPTAMALGLLCIALLAFPAQAQSFRGFTCENLWEHVYAGGTVIFESTNRWFHNTCTQRETEAGDEAEDNIAEPTYRPPDVTCPHLPARVVVTGYAVNSQCQMVDEVVISGHPQLQARGFIDAVDVYRYVNGGLEVCFRDAGWLVFLDAAYSPRLLMELAQYQRGGMTCGEIDRAGTVVLLREGPPTADAPATLPVFDVILLHDCQIKLVETLFLRVAPAGEIIGLVWLYSEVPVFEVSGDWYKTEFEGVTRLHQSLSSPGFARRLRLTYIFSIPNPSRKHYSGRVYPTPQPPPRSIREGERNHRRVALPHNAGGASILLSYKTIFTLGSLPLRPGMKMVHFGALPSRLR